MSITLQNVDGGGTSGKLYREEYWGQMKVVFAQMLLDSSYPSGGYGASQGLSKQRFGMKDILGARVIGWNGSASMLGDFRWDYANNKLVALQTAPVPPLVVEEVVTVASNAGRLARVPGYILSCEGVAGSVTGAFRVIPTGKTPTTKMVAVNFVTGALATLSTDAVTSMRITYIPLGVGQFTEANRVVDEAVTFGSGAGDTFNLANRAACIQYVWNDTVAAGSRLPMIQPVGEAPATNEIAIDINNSGATTVTLNTAQDTNTGLVTYFKYSASWIADHNWTDQADITVTSTTVFSVADDLAIPPQGIWIPGFGNVIVGEATATNKQAVLEGAQGTAGADIILYNPIRGSAAMTGADGYTTFEVPYLFLNSIINSYTGITQVPTGANLAASTVRMILFGRPV